MNSGILRRFLWPALLPIRFTSGFLARRYLPPLLQFGYAEDIESDWIRWSPLLVAEHFVRVGRRQVLIGERRISFEFEGRRSDYVESAYLAANPDVQELVSAGTLQDGLEHFLFTGYAQVQSGHRRPYPQESLLSILQVLEGSDSQPSRFLCYYAHYDVEDQVDPYVIHALSALKAQGCAIIFCSGTLGQDQIQKLLPLVKSIVLRNRFGYDFTSWAAGLMAFPLTESYEKVILTNDSYFFPVGSPEKMFSELSRSLEDVWGLTASWQGWRSPTLHLQSYFLALNAEGVQSSLLGEMVTKQRSIGILSRRGVIEEFELWFSAKAEELGLSIGTMVDGLELAGNLAAATQLNPTVHRWDQLITVYKLPILKVAVVRDNPVGNFSMKKFEELDLDFPLGLMKGYLARVDGKSRGVYRDPLHA